MEAKYRAIEVGTSGGEWCVFDGNGPPNAGHLRSTDKRLVERMCVFLNAVDIFTDRRLYTDRRIHPPQGEIGGEQLLAKVHDPSKAWFHQPARTGDAMPHE